MLATTYKKISETKKMTGIPVLYSVPFNLLETALKHIDSVGKRGIKSKDLFAIIDYKDATGKSMFLKFSIQNKLIMRESKSLLKITMDGRKFIQGDEEFKKQHLLNNLDSIYIEILKMLSYSKDKTLDLNSIMNRLGELTGYIESPRVTRGKKAFLKRFLTYLDIVELEKGTKDTFIITKKGETYLLAILEKEIEDKQKLSDTS